MLFLMHACGARTWKLPQGASRHLLTPAEAAFQPPEGQAKLYMDGPWRLQWPCLIPWALMQAAVTVTWLRNATASGQPCKNLTTREHMIGLNVIGLLFVPSCICSRWLLRQQESHRVLFLLMLV